MKRLFVSLVAGVVALAAVSPALALPPSPIREAAQLRTEACPNPAGRLTHGIFVSFVALTREIPNDPVLCERPGLGD